MQNHPQLVLNLFAQKHHPVGLDAAGGGAGHAATYSHKHQYGVRKNRPGAVVSDAEPCRRGKAHDVEEAGEEGAPPGLLEPVCLDRDRHDHPRHNHHGKIELEYLVLERLEGSCHDSHEDHSEMDG